MDVGWAPFRAHLSVITGVVISSRFVGNVTEVCFGPYCFPRSHGPLATMSEPRDRRMATFAPGGSGQAGLCVLPQNSSRKANHESNFEAVRREPHAGSHGGTAFV